jgi:hypothetical protein
MGKFLNSPFGSWLKVFAIAVLVKFQDLGADVFSLDLESVKHLVQAGIVALIPVIINSLNPSDTRYGRGAE